MWRELCVTYTKLITQTSAVAKAVCAPDGGGDSADAIVDSSGHAGRKGV
jgi:hypothetical protein